MLASIARLPLRAIPKHAVVPILSGPNRGFRWVVGSHTHGCWLGGYERHEQTVIQKMIRPNMTVLDIGAHVGFYTLLLSRLVGTAGHVIAFEPYPPSYEGLVRHLRLNHITNVTVKQAAMSDSTGSNTLYVGSVASASLVPMDHGLRPHAVPTITLDDYRPQIPGRIGFIKMDIEGAEGLAMEGMLQTLAADLPALYISLHGGPREANLIRKLERLGYLLTRSERDLIAHHPSVSA